MLTQLGVVLLGISFMQSPLHNINSTETNYSTDNLTETNPNFGAYVDIIQPIESPAVLALAFSPPVFSPAAGHDTEAPAGRADKDHMARSNTAGPGSGSAVEPGPGGKFGREIAQAHLPSPDCKIPSALASEAAAGHRLVAARSARLARVRTMDCTHRADECGASCQTHSSKPAAMTVARPISG